MTDPFTAIGQALAVLASLSAATADMGRIDKAMTDAGSERAGIAKLVRGLAVSSIEAAPGVVELPEHGGGAGPEGGGAPPASIGAAVDRFGTAIAYCPARVGSFGSAGNRTSIPGTPTSATPIAAFVSAGRDRTFQTTCLQALSGSPAGDDRVLVQPHHDLLRLRYALAAGIRGKTADRAAMDCAAIGKLFLPYDPAADATGCK